MTVSPIQRTIICQLDKSKTATYDGDDNLYYYISPLYSIRIEGINISNQNIKAKISLIKDEITVFKRVNNVPIPMIVPLVHQLEEFVLTLKDKDFDKYNFHLKDKYGPFEEDYLTMNLSRLSRVTG